MINYFENYYFTTLENNHIPKKKKENKSNIIYTYGDYTHNKKVPKYPLV